MANDSKKPKTTLLDLKIIAASAGVALLINYKWLRRTRSQCVSSGAPEQELTLHTTFGKNAKRLEHLSANMPRCIIELSVRQWRNYVW